MKPTFAPELATSTPLKGEATKHFCECLNVCVKEWSEVKKSALPLSQERIQQIAEEARLCGLRECPLTIEMKHPSLVGKKEHAKVDVFRCYMCNTDFLAVYKNRRLLPDTLTGSEESTKNEDAYSEIFSLHFGWDSMGSSSSLVENHIPKTDFFSTSDFSRVAEKEKTRLYEDLQRRLYEYIQAEEEKYNDACELIDIRCKKLTRCEADAKLNATPLSTNELDSLRQKASTARDRVQEYSEFLSATETQHRNNAIEDLEFDPLSDENLALMEAPRMPLSEDNRARVLSETTYSAKLNRRSPFRKGYDAEMRHNPEFKARGDNIDSPKLFNQRVAQPRGHPGPFVTDSPQMSYSPLPAFPGQQKSEPMQLKPGGRGNRSARFTPPIARSVPVAIRRPDLSGSNTNGSGSMRRDRSATPEISDSEEDKKPGTGEPKASSIIPPHTYRAVRLEHMVAHSIPHKYDW